MKLQLGLLLALTVAAGPAAAQGTFSPGQRPGSTFGSPTPSSAAKPKTYLPATPAPSAKPRTSGAPEAPKAAGFEPYKPFTGGSVYSSKSAAPSGAKPCQTSVYVNACGDKR